MTKTAHAVPADNTVPTEVEMLEMLNVDVLPYFDGYDEDSFSFNEKYRAVNVVRVNQKSCSFSLNTGVEIEVAKDYFEFPGAQKEITLHRLKSVLS